MKLSEKLKSMVYKGASFQAAIINQDLIEDMLKEVEQWEKKNLTKCPVCDDDLDIIFEGHCHPSKKVLDKLNQKYTFKELENHVRMEHAFTRSISWLILHECRIHD
jgi:hypothetical protein